MKGAEGALDQFMDKNGVEGLMFKMAVDPRVTRIGHFVRKRTIDEFPQFVDVLLEQMYVVGSRPPLSREMEWHDAWAKQGLDAKLGPSVPGRWMGDSTWTSTT